METCCVLYSSKLTLRNNRANDHPIILQKARMEKTIDTVRSNFNSIRTGRSNPAMLDKIEVHANF